MPLLENLSIERSSGPTVLSRKPVVRLSGALRDSAGFAKTWPGLIARIEAAIAAAGVQDLPGQPRDRHTDEVARSLFAQLARSITPDSATEEIGRLLAAAAASLMAAARAPHGVWGTVTADPPRFLAYWDDWMDGVGLAAAHGVVALVEAGHADPEEPLETAAKDALAKVRAARVEGFVYPLVRAAEERGIPWRLLVTKDLVVVYGQGSRQRWIRSTLSDAQSYASVYISLRKDVTSKLLARAGFPVPEHRRVKSRAEAIAAAEAMAYPLVVKPLAGTRADNVSLWLDSAEKVGAAYDLCGRDGTDVLVERQAMGEPYRITVFAGRAVAAGRHSLPYVTGDGVSTIEELIAAWDACAALPVFDGYARFFPINRSYYAEQMAQRLEEQGLTPDSVPEDGREVLLGYIPRRDGGGLYVEATDRMHPGLMRMAEEIATVFGSPNLGVDIITTDITKPPGSVPLAVNEVNSSPSPRAHEQTESPRRIAGLALAGSFPGQDRSERGGDAGRIPLAAFYEFADLAVLDHLEALLAAAGWVPGVAGPRDARIAGYALRPRGGTRHHPGRAVLYDRRADAALLGIELSDLSRRGLPSDHADVAAFAPGSLAGDDRLARAAAATLAGLPGGLLLTAAGETAGWLREACAHRRWIVVAAPHAEASTPPEGTEILRCEADGAGGRRALLCGTLRRDVLCDRLDENQAEAQLWALAALLGLGFAPGEIRQLALQSEESIHAVSS